MSYMQKFNQEQQNALRHIAQRNGFFFRNHGSQELTEDGDIETGFYQCDLWCRW